MTDIEQRLTRCRENEVGERAATAARRLAERAAEDGGLDVAYGIVDSPVGELLLAVTKRGLVRLAFADEERVDEVLSGLAAKISPRILEAPQRLDRVRAELDEYFEGKRTDFDLPVDWSLIHGFGRLVLRTTARIPYGQTMTYRDVATRAGNPRASRAAGNALGGNPIAIVIPCHRVLRTGGNLGGYGGGLDNKEWLLRLEGARD